MQLAPEPRVHSAHRRSHRQPRMIQAECLGKQPILRFHHIQIAVAREFCVHPVTRLARFAMTDAVRKYDKKLGCIERLTFPK